MLIFYGENTTVGREMGWFENYLGNSEWNLVTKISLVNKRGTGFKYDFYIFGLKN